MIFFWLAELFAGTELGNGRIRHHCIAYERRITLVLCSITKVSKSACHVFDLGNHKYRGLFSSLVRRDKGIQMDGSAVCERHDWVRLVLAH